MVSRICNKIWAAAFLVLALGLATSAALAHDDSQAGDYKLVVGFVVEPAYEGLPNGGGSPGHQGRRRWARNDNAGPHRNGYESP